MGEVNETVLKPWLKALVATSIIFGVMNLMVHYKFNGPSNAFSPFVRFACKLSIFSWMVYGGRFFERKHIGKEVIELKDIVKTKEDEINILNSQIQKNASLYENLERQLKSKHEHELKELSKFYDTLKEKLKKYEKTASQVNSDALRSLL